VLGRLTLDSVGTLGSDVNGSIRALGYSYNALGLLYQDTSYGDAAATSVKNQVEYLYNGFGQLTDEYQNHTTTVNTSTTPDVHYDYGTSGSNPSVLADIVYPGGRQINYIYDLDPVDEAIGRIDGIADNANSTVDLVTYQYLGPSTIVETNSSQPGIQQLTSLDPFGRVADQDYVQTSTGQSTTQLQYGYDQDGNVLYSDDLTNVSSADGNASTDGQLYSYDALNRLVSFERGTLASGDTSITGTPSANETWTLDNVGNMDSVTSAGTTTSRTINTRNQIAADGSSSLSYDGNGNTLTDNSGNTYTYDAWNRMATATVGGIAYSYAYDATSQRIQEDDTSSSTTDLYYDNQGQVVEERQTTSGGTQIKTNVWGQQYVNDLVSSDVTPADSSTATRYYFEHDGNFDTTAVTDASGNVLQRFEYDPYGKLTVLSASYGSSSAAPLTAYLFQGGRLDSLTGLSHFGARDYNPATGTWMEQDPTGYQAGVNFYEFERSAPPVLRDPRGLDSDWIDRLKALGGVEEMGGNPDYSRDNAPGVLGLGFGGEFTLGGGGSGSLVLLGDTCGNLALVLTTSPARLGLNVGLGGQLIKQRGITVPELLNPNGPPSGDIAVGLGPVSGSVSGDTKGGVQGSVGMGGGLAALPSIGVSVGYDAPPDVLWQNWPKGTSGRCCGGAPPAPTTQPAAQPNYPMPIETPLGGPMQMLAPPGSK
jgi:RHS repeat-associated protein